MGSLWVVVDRCGSLWVVPGFSNYGRNSPVVITSTVYYMYIVTCRYPSSCSDTDSDENENDPPS